MVTFRASAKHKWLGAFIAVVMALFVGSQSANARSIMEGSYTFKKYSPIYVQEPVYVKKRAKKRYTKKRVSTKKRRYTKKRTSTKKRRYTKKRTSTKKRRYSKKRSRSSSRGRGSLMATLKRVKPKGLPLRLAAAVVTVESGWRVNARGSSGERGLMQLMPATARSMGARGNLYNPAVNMRAGTKYLHYCYRRAKRNVAATIGCYNRGPGKMWAWSGNSITRRYVGKVRRYMRRG